MPTLKFYKSKIAPKKFPHIGERLTHDFGDTGQVIPVRKNKLFVHTDGFEFYKSESRGETFELVNSNMLAPPAGLRHNGYSCADGGNKLTGAALFGLPQATEIKVYQSTDGGVTESEKHSMTITAPETFQWTGAFAVGNDIWTFGMVDPGPVNHDRYARIYKNGVLDLEVDAGAGVDQEVEPRFAYDAFKEELYFTIISLQSSSGHTGGQPFYKVDSNGRTELSTMPTHPIATVFNGVYGPMPHMERMGMLAMRQGAEGSNFLSRDMGKTWENIDSDATPATIFAQDFIGPKRQVLFTTNPNFGSDKIKRSEGPVFEDPAHFDDYKDFVESKLDSSMNFTVDNIRSSGINPNRTNRRFADIVRWETT